MDPRERVEAALARSLAHSMSSGCPPRLARAMQYAVFPGGARVRPRLCVAVALACGDDRPDLVDAAAAAIELLHCASLVHDDLPSFDNAALRRGRPSVHVACGEDVAILTGDALIVMAFQTLAREGRHDAQRLAPLLLTIGNAVGAPHGVVAGQAWESEPDVTLLDYEAAKTGSLFAAATAAGAQACGAAELSWLEVGARIGQAFQVADDIHDLIGDAETMGKPVGQDAVHRRPNMARQYGVDAAKRHLEQLIEGAIHCIPPCPGAKTLRRVILEEAQNFIPRGMGIRAA